MRKVLALVCFISHFIFSISAFASYDAIGIRVIDPDSAPIAGARVTVYPLSSNKPLAMGFTGADGKIVFGQVQSFEIRVEVLAPGFAPGIVSSKEQVAKPFLNVQLKLASRDETVVVTANDTPLPIEDSGSRTSVLDRETLELLQPVSMAEVLRFMPGAIVNSTGRRGSLTSLFVR